MSPTNAGSTRITAGEYIRRLREARGMSVADLVRALGVAYSTVTSWEKKGAVPDRKITALLVEKLQLTREERQGLLEACANVSPNSPRSRGATSSPRTAYVPASETPDQRREAMSDALTKALDTQRHTVMDAIFILDALGDGGEAFLSVADRDVAARAWLDGAALLRSRKLPVNAATLAAVLPEVLASEGPEARKR
jgi:transcriptional regulator with XRE-family HTH domain